MPSQRGGKRAGAGRKPLGPCPMQPVTVWLTGGDVTTLRDLGQGNVSAGARRVLRERARETAVFRYVEAHDLGDLESIAEVLAQATDDPELARQLREVDAALHAEHTV